MFFLGEEAEGTILPNGKKLKYTLSGHLQFWITIILMGHFYPQIIKSNISPNIDNNSSFFSNLFSNILSGNFSGFFSEFFSVFSGIYSIKGFSPLKLTLLYDNYIEIMVVSIIGAWILSIYLYVTSFIGTDKILAKGGNTGNHIYDFFIGKKN